MHAHIVAIPIFLGVLDLHRLFVIDEMLEVCTIAISICIVLPVVDISIG